MIRLFAALDLPDFIQDALAELQSGVPGAKWVRPEALHLTLRFIGEVDGARFRDIVSALDVVHAPGFDIAFSEMGLFGDRHRARTLWAGVKPNPALIYLQTRIEQAIQRAGLPPEGRKFQPHVTLARLAESPAERLARYIEEVGRLNLPSFSISSFTLFSSFLSHSGAIYTPEEVYWLAPPQPIEAGRPLARV